MKGVIIDDELKSREVLDSIISQFIDGIEIIGGAPDISGGISLIESVKPDIVFLDISLKDGDSFAILNQLNHIEFKIIFITAFDEYATQAINFTRIPCLNKPIDIDELERAVQKALQTEIVTVQEDVSVILNILNSKFNIIPIIDVFKVTFINDNELLYIAKKSNESAFITVKGEEIISWYPFSKYIQLLKNHSFAQPNKDYLVQMDSVNKYPNIADNEIELSNNAKVPLFDDYKSDFIKRYGSYTNRNSK